MALAGEGDAAAIEKLRTTALLTEIREPKPGGGWAFSYEVHPLVGRLAARRSDRADACARRVTAAPATTSSSWRGRPPPGRTTSRPPTTCGRWARPTAAYDLLAPLVQWLLQRGRVLDARAVLAEIGDPGSLHPSRAAWVQHLRRRRGGGLRRPGRRRSRPTAPAWPSRERLAAADPSNAGWQRDLSVSHEQARRRAGGAGASWPTRSQAYQASLAIREQLAAADPSNAGWQRDLSVSHNKIGDVLVAQGHLAGALTRLPREPRHPRAAGGGRPEQRRLAARPLGQPRARSATCWWRRASSTARSRPTATASPSPSGWPRPTRATPTGSATSRSATNKLGDVLVAQGQLADALTAYRASLAICERLAAADPSNAGWQRDLSVSHEQDRRRAGGAGAARRRARRLPRQPRHRRAAGRGRSEQRRLAARPLGQPRAGSATCWWRRASWPGALDAYRESLAIREQLAAADPSNAELAARPLGQPQQDRRRAGGAGRSRRRARAPTRTPRHRRAAGRGRPEQRRVAARPLGEPRASSATCWWRRASWPARSRLPGQPRHRRAAGGARSEQRRLAARPLGRATSKIGDVLVAQGQLAGAIVAFEGAVAGYRQAACEEPGRCTVARVLGGAAMAARHTQRQDGRAELKGGAGTSQAVGRPIVWMPTAIDGLRRSRPRSPSSELARRCRPRCPPVV